MVSSTYIRWPYWSSGFCRTCGRCLDCGGCNGRHYTEKIYWPGWNKITCVDEDVKMYGFERFVFNWNKECKELGLEEYKLPEADDAN